MADPTELFKLCLQMPNAYHTDVPDESRREHFSLTSTCQGLP